MIITCPNCKGQSEIDKPSLYPGASLSCACGHVWTHGDRSRKATSHQTSAVSFAGGVTITDISVPFSRVFSITFQVLLSAFIILIPVWVLLFLLSFKPG